MNVTPFALPGMHQQRRILHHIKCLVWCLHQMQTRYDLNLVLYSLEHGSVHPEILDSNLGDNLMFLVDQLQEADLHCLRLMLSDLPESIGSLDVDDKHFEIGHYLQTTREFHGIPSGSYGIIAQLSPHTRGLFSVSAQGGHLSAAAFDPADVRVIFGTYIV